MKRLTVYPELRAIAILGKSAPALNAAMECWAKQIAEATNSLTLSPVEWSYLADCCNGTIWSPVESGDGAALALQVTDAERFDNLGAKWDCDVKRLAKTLQALSFVQARAVISAIQFFWDHHHDIDLQNDAWWTIPYRTATFEGELAA